MTSKDVPAVSLDGVAWKTAEVAIALLRIDPRLQRPLDMAWVHQKAKEYAPAALGTVTISKRKNGDMVLLDGQHRHALVKFAKDAGRRLDAKIYEQLTIQQEAELFRRLNDSRRLTPLVKFRIAVVEGKPTEVACDKILRENGLQAEPGHPNSYVAVRVLVDLYGRDPVACAATVGFLSTAWGKVNRDALDGRMVAGTGLFFARYGEEINTGQLAQKLQKNGTPAALIGEASVLAKMRKVKVPHAVADKLTNIYNANRKEENKLPAWG